MIKVVNKLVMEKRFFPARAYSDFARDQLRDINGKLVSWLKKQSFAKTAPDPRYGSIVVDGDSSEISGEHTDHLEWHLDFKELFPEKLCGPQIPKSFSNGLLHISRMPEVTSHNSAPQLFHPVNYFDVRVNCPQKGWVTQGGFPSKAHISARLKNPEAGELDLVAVPVFTDTRRDAEAGFMAAFDWAKFRTMAVACKDYIFEKLNEEGQKLIGLGEKGYWPLQLFRSRVEATIPLMLGFFPDTRRVNGKTALRPYYTPGVLETTLALILQEGITPAYGNREGDYPIGSAKSFPAEIDVAVGKRQVYDMTFPVKLHTYFDSTGKDETQKSLLTQALGKYFDIDFTEVNNPVVRIHVKDAAKVREEILAGAQDTSLHSQTYALLGSLKQVNSLSRSWRDEQQPTLETGYKVMIEAGKRAHFGRLDRMLEYISRSRNYKK